MPVPPSRDARLERRQIAAAQGGDKLARDRVVEDFTPLIAGVARRYSSRGLGHDELMQQGTLGLLRALQRFDADRGIPFWGYASWWVRQAMQELVAELTLPVVLSDRAYRQLARVKQARREHLQEHRAQPSTQDLVERTGLPRPQIEKLVAVDGPARALEAPASGTADQTRTLGDLVSDPRAEDDFEHAAERVDVSRVGDLSAAGLGEREQGILDARLGLGGAEQTLREIAGRYGITAERVRQIEQGALGKLREAIGAARSTRPRRDARTAAPATSARPSTRASARCRSARRSRSA
jgi:RNA polymerase primary sigma factor